MSGFWAMFDGVGNRRATPVLALKGLFFQKKFLQAVLQISTFPACHFLSSKANPVTSAEIDVNNNKDIWQTKDHSGKICQS